ncbi:amino acid-binding protein [bacterium]|nr:MAG: amino acid-binding protein [bacterium]
MEYKVQRQLTAAIENVPGRLADISEIISRHHINIEGICVVDNVEQGVIRLITTQPAEVKRLLKEQDIYIVEADVLTVELTDQLGALAKITASLATEKINIDYLYCTSQREGIPTKIVFKVSDMVSAQRILGALEVS